MSGPARPGAAPPPAAPRPAAPPPALSGRARDVSFVDHGPVALAPGGLLHDDAHGGWCAAAPVAERSPVDTTEAVHAQVFAEGLARAAAAPPATPARSADEDPRG